MYPVTLNVKGRRCLVVGGGWVALRKVEGLIAEGAQVTVVTPEAVGPLAPLAKDQAITLEKRAYRPGEAAAFPLVFAATDDREVNRRVSEDAASAGGGGNAGPGPDPAREAGLSAGRGRPLPPGGCRDGRSRGEPARLGGRRLGRRVGQRGRRPRALHVSPPRPRAPGIAAAVHRLRGRGARRGPPPPPVSRAPPPAGGGGG